MAVGAVFWGSPEACPTAACGGRRQYSDPAKVAREGIPSAEHFGAGPRGGGGGGGWTGVR